LSRFFTISRSVHDLLYMGPGSSDAGRDLKGVETEKKKKGRERKKTFVTASVDLGLMRDAVGKGRRWGKKEEKRE